MGNAVFASRGGESVGCRSTSFLIAALLAASGVCAVPEASAQGLFDWFSGSAPRTPAYQQPSYQGREPPEPSASRATAPHAASAGFGRSGAFCVRLCDGRYFPLQSYKGVNSAQLCGSLCPASQTRVFWGSEIVRAVAGDGTRYATLDNALVYRKRIVPGCTCNGKDPFGLARLDVNTDPTLKSGDVVSSPGVDATTPESRQSR